MMASYSLSFTITDALSTDAGELQWWVRTAASNGGTALANGTATSGQQVTIGTINDTGLVHGSNQRFLYVTDGAGNVLDQSFVVTAEFALSSTATAGAGSGVVAAGVVFDGHSTSTARAGAGSGVTARGIVTPLYSVAIAGAGSGATADGIPTPLFSTARSGAGSSAIVTGIVPYLFSSARAGAGSGALADGVLFTLYVSSIAQAEGGSGATTDFQVLDAFVYSVAIAGSGSGARVRGVAWPIRSSITVIAPRTDPLFYVAIYPAAGKPNRDRRLDWIDINADVTGLNWQSSMPGGFSRLSVGIDTNDRRYDEPLADPLIPRELITEDFAHVAVTNGGVTLWEGRIEDRDMPPGATRTLVAQGYGYTATHDYPFFSPSPGTTLTTTATVLQQIIASAAPALRAAYGAGFVDPQVAHAPVEFDRLFLSQVLDQVTKEGDSAGNLMDWAVWQGRLLYLSPRVAPQRPHYWVPFDERYVSAWKRHAADRVGTVWVEHTVDNVNTLTGPVTDPRFVNEVGFQRGKVLKAGEITVAGALRMARTYLQFHSRERYTGTVTIGPDDVLIGYGGRPVPAYLARAGEWVQVGDYEPLMIVTQEYNANARRQKLQLGDRTLSWNARVAQMMRDVELQKLGTDPVGGRRR